MPFLWYKLRFHRCGQKHSEYAQQSSEWSIYAWSVILVIFIPNFFKSPSQVILLGRAILLQAVLKHIQFILKITCIFEGTFYRKAVCQPVSIQERPRHPSCLFAADTHRCWSDKRQCRTILNLLHILKFYWQTTRYTISNDGGLDEIKRKTPNAGKWNTVFPQRENTVTVWGWLWPRNS